MGFNIKRIVKESINKIKNTKFVGSFYKAKATKGIDAFS